MKKGLLLIILLTFGWVGIASSTPVSFNTSMSESNVSLGGSTSVDWFLGEGSLNASLNSDLVQTFTLDDGESFTFDFIDFSTSVEGIAGGDYTVAATLGFATPDEADVTASGSGVWGSAFGVVSGGTLNWVDMPTTFSLLDGNILTVAFDDGITLGIGTTTTVHATVTNNGGAPAPVPEPGTLLLLGSGLAGLALYRRKRMK